ncbi:hypothetical protein BGX33_009587 [Mortierella sp. NVP41]|nr:hypothetical protein BGX33_009587 [Mortierella sp. NVP41]
MTGADDKQTKLTTIATNVKGGITNSIKYLVPHVSPPGQRRQGDGMGNQVHNHRRKREPGKPPSSHPTRWQDQPGGVGAIVPVPVKGSKPAHPKPAAAVPAPSAAASANGPHAPVRAAVPPAAAGVTAAAAPAGLERQTLEKDVVGINSHKASSAVTSSAMAVAAAVVAGGLHTFVL